jgi:hypothetical protein
MGVKAHQELDDVEGEKWRPQLQSMQGFQDEPLQAA